MNAALGEQLAWAELATEVKVVVLTGAGQGFCAGGDVKGMNSRNEGGSSRSRSTSPSTARGVGQRATAGKLFTMPKPTIAALPGPAAGAGLSLALACDLRIMAKTAIMTTAFARVGFSGDYGGTYFLTQLVGSAKARELYYLSERVTADEALRLGPDQLGRRAGRRWQAKTREVAARLAAGPTIAYRYMKENLNRAMAGEVGSDPSRALRDGGSQGSGSGLRRQARAGLHRKIGVRAGWARPALSPRCVW